MRKALFYLLFIFYSSNVIGQGILDLELKEDIKGKSLVDVLNSIDKEYSAKFYFLPKWLESIKLSAEDKGESLQTVLERHFMHTDYAYVKMYPNVIVIIKDPSGAIARKETLETAINHNKKVDRLIIKKSDTLKPDRFVQITGHISDSDSDEPIPMAYIDVVDSDVSTSSDENGNFQLTLASGDHVLSISFSDYQTKIVDLSANDDGQLALKLEKQSVLLDEVVIEDRWERDMKTSRIGQSNVDIKKIQRKPAFLGEVDLVKQVQNMAGVTTVGEAASGFNVRGGSVDQNLILYDGIPVFNNSHVFGFFSGFNSEALQGATFYRGGIPAKYGGRASSVLDIQSKNGDYKRWNGKLGVGIITGNLTVNGPLKNDKTALAVSVRSTYSNWLIHTVDTDYADMSDSDVSFYDASLRFSHIFNEKSSIAFSGYKSHDSFSLFGDSTYRWNNFQFSSTLEHQYSTKLNATITGGVSSYGYKVTNEDFQTASELAYRITSSTIKADFNLKQKAHTLNFGLSFTHYIFNPGSLSPNSSASNAKDFSLDKQYAVSSAIYLSDQWNLGAKFNIEIGTRIPLFTSFGPASVYKYRKGAIREIFTITDTLNFKSGEPIKTYIGFEPRLSFRWEVGAHSSIKLGYNRIYQYLHLVTNTTAVTPIDIWQPSSYYFKPQRADQVSLGYFQDFNEQAYGFSTEGFYKQIDNILDFKDGAQLILNEHLETDLLQGKGTSYGVETSIFKNSGRFTGSINYTYSRAFRTIKGSSSIESINRGKQYPASYDQPHVLNVTWKYNLSSRHYFTGNFTYHKGRPITVPLSVLTFENTSVAYFSARNQYRIPDYHRLDVALVIEGNHKKNKKWEGTWVFSIYNVYSRKNPYTIFFKNSDEGIPKPYQLSIIGTILPSITYKIELK